MTPRQHARRKQGEFVAHTSTYLNFTNETEAAFTFYKSVFGTEYVNGIMRMGDIPPMEGMPAPSDDIRDLVINVQLPITGGHLLMGTDVPEGMGFTVDKGNNISISLHPDSRAEADRLFAALSEGGIVKMAMCEQFWGDYYGALVDKFGIHWMIDTASKE